VSLTADLHSPQALAFRDRTRGWLDENRPEETVKDATAIRTPEERDQARGWARRLHEGGLAGVTWPTEYGGQGASLVEQIIVTEELIRAGVPSHVNVIGTDIAGPTILVHGNDEQRRRYLPRILSADELWCQGFSEPDAGSDLAALRTFARRDADEFVLEGQKIWSSYAHAADHCIVLARTARGERPHDGLTMFIVDMGTSGVEVRPLKQMTGGQQFSEIFFTDVSVPLENTIGEIGTGWRIAMDTLMHERATLGFRLAARSARLLDRVLALASAQRADGRPGLANEHIRDRLAQTAIEIEAVRLYNYRTLADVLEHGPRPEQSLAKLQWSETNQRLAQLGYELALFRADIDSEPIDTWEYEVLRSRGNTIEAGTSQVLRTVIAQRVLGLPRPT
jgi:alkylation response protein AidB-like acyl-CoA dehydrogenase